MGNVLRVIRRPGRSLWKEIRNTPITIDASAYKAREAVAMTATARLMYNSAKARTETRGMHKRTDFPTIDINQRYRLISSGLDEIKIRTEQVAEEAVSV